MYLIQNNAKHFKIAVRTQNNIPLAPGKKETVFILSFFAVVDLSLIMEFEL